MNYKIKAAEMVSSYVGLDMKTVYEFMEIPKKKENADFTLPCFKLSKYLNKNPNIIAKELCENIFSREFEKVENTGPYLNFFINKSIFSYEIINSLLKKENIYDKNKNLQSKTICIECLLPKNKDCLKMRDLISMITGRSLTRIYKIQNNNVVTVGYIKSESKWNGFDEVFINNIISLLRYKFDEIHNEKVYSKELYKQHFLQEYIFYDGFIKFISLEKFNMAPYIIWTKESGNTDKLNRLNSFIEINSKYKIDKYIHIGDLFDNYEFEQVVKILRIIQGTEENCEKVEFLHNDIVGKNIVSLHYNNLLMEVLNYLNNEREPNEKILGIIFDFFVYIGEKEKILNKDNKYEKLDYIKNTNKRIEEIIMVSKDLEFDWSSLTTKERISIVNKLNEFKIIVDKAADELSPSSIAIYILELTRAINKGFFDTYDKSFNKSEIELLRAALKVINYGLYLLGIDDK